MLLAGFVLRTIHLQHRSLWYDEAFAVLYGSLSPARMLYGTVTPVPGAGAADVHPLLYYFLLHGWMKLVGRSPLAVRFLSVILGTVTVALLWRLAAWCFDRRTGMVVGLLAAVNPFHVAYSQETRMYALLGLGATLAGSGLLRALASPRQGGSGRDTRRARTGNRRGRSLLVRALDDEDWPAWGLYAVGAALTLYAHGLGAFVLLALHVVVLCHPRWWLRIPPLVLADLITLTLFSPWLVGVLPGQMAFATRGYWLTPPGPTEFVRALMLPVLTFYEPAPQWLLGMGLFTGLLSLALLVLQSWRRRSQARWFLVLSWCPILVLFAVSQWQPLYLERALLPSALFYAVSLGWLLARGRLPNLLRRMLVLLLALSTAGSLINHFRYVGFPRPPFQEASAYLEDHVQPGDVVVHTDKLTYFPMHLYAPQLPAKFRADPPGSPEDTLAQPTQEALGIFATAGITEAVDTADRVWVVYFERELVEHAAATVSQHPVTWLEHHFVRHRQMRFDDLAVRLYQERRP